MGDMQDKEPLQPGKDRPINSIVSPDRGPVKGHNSTAAAASSTSDFGYEELSNGLTCPTCQGTGKIPRGQEDDLVALIPYRDDRLKPRRTICYVCLAVFICMAVAGILCAFFIPRSISFVDVNVDTVKADLNVSKELKLALVNYFNVTNQNFLSLDVKNVSVQVVNTFNGRVIKNPVVEVIDQTIPPRSKKQQFKVPVNLTVLSTDYPLTYCDPSKSKNHGIYMIFTTTIYYQYMFQDSQSTLMHYQLVSCMMSQPEQSQRRSRRNQFNSGVAELGR